MIDKDMSFKELGELLRLERERQGVSMDQVVKATMLNRRKVTAIEEGRVDELPHPVYAKGFIKNYAQLLGLDTDPISEIIDRAYGVKPAADTLAPIQERIMAFGSPGADRERDRPRSREKKSFLPTLLVLLVLLALLGGLIMFIRNPGQAKDTGLGSMVFGLLHKAGIGRQADTAPPAPAVIPVERPAPAPPAPEAAPEPAGTLQGEQSLPDDPARQAMPSQKAVEALSTAFKKDAPAPAAAPTQSPGPLVQNPAQEQSAAPQNANEPHVVITASARGNCWGQVQIDGGEIKKFYVQNGQAARFAYGKSLWLRLGNPAAVTLVHNGQPVKIEAAPGQVRTITFP